jgi:hypothetical protein
MGPISIKTYGCFLLIESLIVSLTYPVATVSCREGLAELEGAGQVLIGIRWQILPLPILKSKCWKNRRFDLAGYAWWQELPKSGEIVRSDIFPT